MVAAVPADAPLDVSKSSDIGVAGTLSWQRADGSVGGTIAVRATGLYAGAFAAALAAGLIGLLSDLTKGGPLVIFGICVFGCGALVHAIMAHARLRDAFEQIGHLRGEVVRMAASREATEKEFIAHRLSSASVPPKPPARSQGKGKGRGK